jgi:hypothetical protein
MKITVIKKATPKIKPMAACPWIVENPIETRTE